MADTDLWGDAPQSEPPLESQPPCDAAAPAVEGEVLLDEPSAAVSPLPSTSPRAAIHALQARRDDPSALDTETPPWASYTPPVDPRTGRMTIDAKAEWQLGVRPKTFAERLRTIGVADMALRIAFDMLQDEDTPAKVRADLAKDLLSRAYGTPGTMGNPAAVQVLIVNDMGG